MSIARRKLIWMIPLMLLLIGVEWMFYALPKVETASLAQSRWAFPAVQRAQPQTALDVLAATSPWGAVVVSRAEAAEEAWRVIGIAGKGKDRAILVQAGQQPERHLTVGDEFPNGGKIVQIDEDGFVVLDKGQRRKIDVFPRGAAGA